MASKTGAELKKMKLAELKKLCTISSLPVTGSKQDLIDRILVYEAAKTSLTVAPEEEAELLDEDDASAVDVRQTITTIVPPVEKQPEIEEKSQVENKNETKSSAEASKPDISKMSQEERAAYRRQRFGGSGEASNSLAPSRAFTNDSEWEKKLERARRFGLPVAAVPKSDSERWKARSERFGTSKIKNETVTENSEELERKRKRLERFGATMSEEEKKKTERALRFGLTEAKKPKTESLV
ncbi:hypothetical protein Aperf_G00000105348 [Anoplocephala perfoliata]